MKLLIDSLETTCVSSSAKFVNEQMETAKEVSKKGKWANQLLLVSEWSGFDIKEDYHTSLYKNKDYVIFIHSCIEYFYPILN
jgi:archaellum biogenesis ATPase FlaH